MLSWCWLDQYSSLEKLEEILFPGEKTSKATVETKNNICRSLTSFLHKVGEVEVQLFDGHADVMRLDAKDGIGTLAALD